MRMSSVMKSLPPFTLPRQRQEMRTVLMNRKTTTPGDAGKLGTRQPRHRANQSRGQQSEEVRISQSSVEERTNRRRKKVEVFANEFPAPYSVIGDRFAKSTELERLQNDGDRDQPFDPEEGGPHH